MEEQLDIVTVVKQYPAHRGAQVSWKAKVERIEADAVVLLAKRKILADDHLDYLVRIENPTANMQEGDKVMVSGTVHGDLAFFRQPGLQQFCLMLENAKIEVLDAPASGAVRTERRVQAD